MTANSRTQALITGAAGGMGRACARLLGLTHDLVLNDVASDRLAAFAEELSRDAFVVTGVISGDTCDNAVLEQIAGALDGGRPFVVVHTAGLSPSMADWESIMRVNLVGTAKLLQAIEPLVVPGSVAILIASTAGHGFPSLPDIEHLLEGALAPEFLSHIRPVVESLASTAGPAGAPGVSYSLSKKGVLKLGERKARDWGPLGGRVVTISPGLMLTPMGRQEVEMTPGAQTVLDAAPVGRPGTAMDIALAARFLASEEAAFISGSDVRVDGGAVSAMQLLAEQRAR